MYSLNKNQVDIVVADVQQASITISHLADDLIDHICCEIEFLMSNGEDFNKAYEKVKLQAGISTLKKIEENTKLLIDQKYRRMKTTMKVTGIISLIMLGLATVFKIMHWPGSGIGFVLGFTILAFVFFPLAVFTNYFYSGKKQNLFLHLSALIGGIVFIIGVQFKVMHWPGAGPMLGMGYLLLLLVFLPTLLIIHVKKAKLKSDKLIYILGTISIIIYGFSNMFKMFHWPGAAILMLTGAFLLISVFLPMYTWRRIQLEGKITGQFVYIITISMFLILFTSLIALNVSRNVLNGFANQADNQKVINDYLFKKNSQLYSNIEKSNDTLDLKSRSGKIKKISNELCQYMDDLQVKILMISQNTDEPGAIKILKNTEVIIQNENQDVVTLYMLGENGEGEGQLLKQKLVDFKSMLITQFRDDEKFLNQLEKLFNVVNNFETGNLEAWEVSTFYSSSVIKAICTFRELQSNVRYCESIALEKLNIKNTNI